MAETILVTGAAGFIGHELTIALLKSSPSIQLVLTDVIEPPVPAAVASEAGRITSIKSDLTSPSAVVELLSQRFAAIYLLHGLMSGGAEANLELGWRVNWDSHRLILDRLRTEFPGTVVVFPSSLAVYGPAEAGQTNTEMTRPVPQSSYGAQKHMVETYLDDMSRRGLLDGRTVRLPTVIVRPGAPSAAASSFASGIVREPLKGLTGVLPVSPGVEMWVSSPMTVVKNLVYVKDLPKEKFSISRVVNLPGITVKVQDILDALEAVGGTKARALVEEKRDPKTEKIIYSWPARFNIDHALSLGMFEDVSLTETVKAFADSLTQ